MESFKPSILQASKSSITNLLIQPHFPNAPFFTPTFYIRIKQTKKRELKSRIYNNKLKDFSTTNVKIQKIAFVIFFLKKTSSLQSLHPPQKDRN